MTGRYRAFGATWHSALPLTEFDTVECDAEADAIFVCVASRPIARNPLRSINGGLVFSDGFRFPWRDEVVFDVRENRLIECLPGRAWTGKMPLAFHSTVAAMTIACRGALPLHASAVEFEGRAVLIAGAAGAGKSTLTAMLLEDGGQLVGDDLTVVRASSEFAFLVSRGRPGIRLHPDTAARLPASDRLPIPDDDRGKWLVRPIARSPHDALPLAGVLLLGGTATPTYGHERALSLGLHLFRPKWLAALPDHASRLRTMLAIAAHVPFRNIDPGAGFHADATAFGRARIAIASLLDVSRAAT